MPNSPSTLRRTNSAPDLFQADLKANSSANWSARSEPAPSPTNASTNASASQAANLNAAASIWRNLKAVEPALPLDYFSADEVPHNDSGVRCVRNEHCVRVNVGEASLGEAPIHAHRQPSPHATDATGAAAISYAAAQAPAGVQAATSRFLIHALESGQGIFQFVSPRALVGGSRKHPSILQELQQRMAEAGSNPRVRLGERFEITDLRRLDPHDAQSDHAQYVIQAEDPTDTQIPRRQYTAVLTQAGLKFTGAVLQPSEIIRASEILDAHQGQTANASQSALPPADASQLVVSHAGIGRNAALIVYRDVCSQIASGSVTATNLDATLQQMIAAHRAVRGPRFIHSQQQLVALRAALLLQFSATAATPSPDRARRLFAAQRELHDPANEVNNLNDVNDVNDRTRSNNGAASNERPRARSAETPSSSTTLSTPVSSAAPAADPQSLAQDDQGAAAASTPASVVSTPAPVVSTPPRVVSTAGQRVSPSFANNAVDAVDDAAADAIDVADAADAADTDDGNNVTSIDSGQASQDQAHSLPVVVTSSPAQPNTSSNVAAPTADPTAIPANDPQNAAQIPTPVPAPVVATTAAPVSQSPTNNRADANDVTPLRNRAQYDRSGSLPAALASSTALPTTQGDTATPATTPTENSANDHHDAAQAATSTPPRAVPNALNQLADSDGKFRFCEADAVNGRLSNFWSGQPIKINGKKYKTVEHYFQAQKYAGSGFRILDPLTAYAESRARRKIRQQILESDQPRQAKIIGHRNRAAALPNEQWEQKRIGVMYEAVYAKFSQDNELKNFLLDTGDGPLIEALVEGRNDKFWGTIDNVGVNMLGQILMQVRDDLRYQSRRNVKIQFVETPDQQW